MKPTVSPNVAYASFPKLQALLDYLDQLGHTADLETLGRLLSELGISRPDVGPACLFKKERYQRNLIKETDWYELVCLCWTSGQRTPIHDHAGSSCAFLVVDGVATETRFEKTPSELICPARTRHHETGYVCASAEADIHQVANMQPAGKDVVTLHCYSPPLRNYNVYSLDTPTAADPAAVRCCGEVMVNSLTPDP